MEKSPTVTPDPLWSTGVGSIYNMNSPRLNCVESVKFECLCCTYLLLWSCPDKGLTAVWSFKHSSCFLWFLSHFKFTVFPFQSSIFCLHFTFALEPQSFFFKTCFVFVVSCRTSPSCFSLMLSLCFIRAVLFLWEENCKMTTTTSH